MYRSASALGQFTHGLEIQVHSRPKYPNCASDAAAAADHSTGYVGADDGFLMRPVDGAVTSPFGYRIHPIYGYWGLHDGTDFGVSCGEGMRAAATFISRATAPRP